MSNIRRGALKTTQMIIEAVKNKEQERIDNAQASKELVSRLQRLATSYDIKNRAVMPDYGATLVESLKLREKSYTPKSDEELLREATLAVSPEYSNKARILKDKTNREVADLGEDKVELSTEYEEAVDDAGEAYRSETERLKNSLIDRNMINSSISGELQDGLSEGYISETKRLLDEYNAAGESISIEISLLTAEKNSALSEYKLEEAAKIETKLNSLKKERQSTIESINSYNKKIAEQELKYRENREKKLLELQKNWYKEQDRLKAEQDASDLINGYSGKKAEEMENRYNLAYGFYSKLPKRQALELIEGDEEALKGILGLYYSRLVENIS